MTGRERNPSRESNTSIRRIGSIGRGVYCAISRMLTGQVGSGGVTACELGAVIGVVGGLWIVLLLWIVGAL